MRPSVRLAIVTATGLFIGLVGGPAVTRPADLDHAPAVDSTSLPSPDKPPEGVPAAGWQRILARRSEARYEARSTPGDGADENWLVTNPDQRMEARFARGGLSIGPRGSCEEPEWSWGARLTGFGPAGAVRPVAEPRLFARGNRVEYRRPGLTEWYVNDGRGLEQGFTIERRPVRGAVRLDVVLELSGSLIPAVNAEGDGLVLRDAAGATVLRYGGLHAYDAERRPLSARMAIEEARTLRIEVEVAGAAFPIVVDPFITTQVAKLTASDAAGGDFFGQSVSISGDTVVVGAYTDDAGSNSGSAYVFDRNAGGVDSWGEVAKLTASDAAADDRLGHSVAISGNTVVLGAVGKGSAYVFDRNAGGAGNWGQVAKLTASNAQGYAFGYSVSISGDTVVVAAVGKRSAYVFDRNAGGVDAWNQVAELTASDTEVGDGFGESVSISGDTVVVGAVNDGDAGSNSGSAYVFGRNAGGADAWDQVAKLTASDAAANHFFGNSVSISEDTVVVGAFVVQSAYVFGRNAGGPDAWDQVAKLTGSDVASGDQFGESVSISQDTIVVGDSEVNDPGSDSGTAYVFARNAGGADAWDQVAKLTASDAASTDLFGRSVSISGDTVVAGAGGNDDAGELSGSAYIFTTHGCGWGQMAKPKASDAAANDLFGVSASISGDTVVVGAYHDDGVGIDSGSAYVFGRNVGGADSWDEVAKLIASDSAATDEFGFSVSISGDTVVVGAAQNDDAGTSSGSAYVFARNAGGADAWDQVAKLTASDAAAGDQFGFSVSIAGDTVVVGAVTDDDGGLNSGSAYVFKRNAGGTDHWGQAAKLAASDAAAGDLFGISVSISGDTVVVGARANDDAGSESGSAYVFKRNAGGTEFWAQVDKLTASDAAAGDWFGYFVSISGDTAVVGAVNNDDAGSNSGSAYVFERNTGGPDNWGEAAKLTASDAAAEDWFGVSVSISGDTIAVGAFQDDGAGSNSGSAYVFLRDEGGPGSWGEVAKLTASDASPEDLLGRSVAISGNTVVVGAYGDDDAGSSSGSAYVFQCLDPAGDPDADAVPNADDCLPVDGGVWSLPGEARNLRLTHNKVSGVTSLSWEAPLVLGGTSVRYDVVRSGTASDFTTSWLCVASDGLGTAADDLDPNPIPPGAVYFYLVRADNDCGPGFAGTTSGAVARQVHDCP